MSSFFRRRDSLMEKVVVARGRVMQVGGPSIRICGTL